MKLSAGRGTRIHEFIFLLRARRADNGFSLFEPESILAALAASLHFARASSGFCLALKSVNAVKRRAEENREIQSRELSGVGAESKSDSPLRLPPGELFLLSLSGRLRWPLSLLGHNRERLPFELSWICVGVSTRRGINCTFYGAIG